MREVIRTLGVSRQTVCSVSSAASLSRPRHARRQKTGSKYSRQSDFRGAHDQGHKTDPRSFDTIRAPSDRQQRDGWRTIDGRLQPVAVGSE